MNTEKIKTDIISEINDLQTTARSFGMEKIKSGSWFNEFLVSCLSSYQERIIEKGGEAWLREKYPGLPTDAIAAKLCDLAEKYSAIAGSVSGATASAAVFTAGVGVPLAVSTIMAEVLFTVRLQLRLVSDLYLLYGIPLNASDPEDLLGIFAVVYGVKLVEVGGVGLKTLGPEVMRAQLYRLIHGNTKAIQAAVNRVLGPRIARSVTQKGILKSAVPVVGVALSAGWNYTATRAMGSRVRKEVRIKADLREQALRMQDKVDTDETTALALVEGLLAISLCDGDFDDQERDVYLTFLRWLKLSPDQLKTFSERIHTDLDGVFRQLKTIEEQSTREALAHCFCLIAAADGVLKPAEKEILVQILDVLDQSEMLHHTEEMCDRFRKESGKMAQAVDVVGDVAGTATDAVGNAMGWMKDRLMRDKSQDGLRSDSEMEADSAELEIRSILQKMRGLDDQLSEAVINSDVYETKWSELEKELIKKLLK